MLEISQAYGWTLPELMQNMSGRELMVRVTHMLIKRGFTFDGDEVAAIREKQQKQKDKDAHERVMAAARQQWAAQGV